MKNIKAISLTIVAMLISLVNTYAKAKVDERQEGMLFHYGSYKPSITTGNIAVTNWNSEEGIKRLERTKFKGDFFRLAAHYSPQMHPSYCGPATGAMVMGSIYEMHKIPAPVVQEWALNADGKTYNLQQRLWNQENFLNDETDKIIDRKWIIVRKSNNGTFGGGMDIDQLKKVFSYHGVKSKLFYTKKKEKNVYENDLRSFRNTIKKAMNDKSQFVIANYDHSYRGSSGAHYSPIAAYDQESDSVLVLDVASHRNSWVWINLRDLFSAMHTKNYAGNNYRGYLLVNTDVSKGFANKKSK
jgi:hypothetical protein